MNERYGIFIDGAEHAAADGGTFDVECPIDGSVLCQVAAASATDVDAAVTSGRAAFGAGTWSRMPTRERARILTNAALLLHERIDDLALTETLSVGRPIRESGCAAPSRS